MSTSHLHSQQLISPTSYTFCSDHTTVVYQSNNTPIADTHTTTRPPPIYDNLFPSNTTIPIPSQESYMIPPPISHSPVYVSDTVLLNTQTEASANKYHKFISATSNKGKLPFVDEASQITNLISDTSPSKTSKQRRFSSRNDSDQQLPEEFLLYRPCYSPEAFKFFMELHIENVLSLHNEREKRRKRLEIEMEKISLSEEKKIKMRSILCQKESEYLRLKRAKMKRDMFKKIARLGVGAFGEVSLVRKRDTNAMYAMKTLRKVDVIRRNQIAHVKAERDILAEADNEWVVKLYYSFQDKDFLYFVMDYIPGGDMMSLLIKFGTFPEHLSMFYVAELVMAIESVHKMGFIHRDIKPDNILIDIDGHIKLTDFGLCTGFRWTHDSKHYQSKGHIKQDSMDASNWSDVSQTSPCDCPPHIKSLKPLERKRLKQGRCIAHSLVGTPNYIAPEVLKKEGYTQLCDWWSVGVIMYEMLIGQPPFLANSAAETQMKILNWQKFLRFPNQIKLSRASKDLILSLCRDPLTRLFSSTFLELYNDLIPIPDLVIHSPTNVIRTYPYFYSHLLTSIYLSKIGRSGASEIKQHNFFCKIDWTHGLRNYEAPYHPPIKSDIDISNFDCADYYSDNEDSIESNLYNKNPKGDKPDVEHAFYEFTFRRFIHDDRGHPIPIKEKDLVNKSGSKHSQAVYV